MRIAICDDDPFFVSHIRRHLTNAMPFGPAPFAVSEFSSISSLMNALHDCEPIDLLYLDIEVGSENGVAAAKQIRKQFRNLLIIFVSSHPKYFTPMVSPKSATTPSRLLSVLLTATETSTTFAAAYSSP